jgi:hypothetical protein
MNRAPVSKFLCLACLIPGFAAASPGENYGPMKFLANHCWKGSFPGGHQTDEHCFTWVYDGKFLRDRHTVHQAGHPDYLGETTYFWNATTRQIEYLYIESQGGFSRGTVSTENNALAFPATSEVEDDKTQTYRSRWERLGSSAYDVVTEFQSGDSWVPGFKVHMTKVIDR